MNCCAALNGLSDKLAALIGENNVGVSLITSDGDTLLINGSEFYDMASVVKFHQAAALAKTMDFDSIMNRMIKVDTDDMHADTWSPMRATLKEFPCEISLVGLLDYSLNYSDNNASDIIFKHFRSPNEVETILRDASLVSDISLRSTESDLHADGNRIPNLTTPDDASRFIYRFFTADTTASATLIKAIMARESPFGKNRIPAGVAEGEAKVFHKTGTGFEGTNGTPRAINDLAFISYKRPGGYSCYSLAVFIRDFKGTKAEGEKLIADISNAVWTSVIVNESMAMNAAAASKVRASKVSKAQEASGEKLSLGSLMFDAVTQIIFNAIDSKLSE